MSAIDILKWVGGALCCVAVPTLGWLLLEAWRAPMDPWDGEQ